MLLLICLTEVRVIQLNKVARTKRRGTRLRNALTQGVMTPTYIQEEPGSNLGNETRICLRVFMEFFIPSRKTSG